MCHLVGLPGTRADTKDTASSPHLRPRALAINNRTSALQDGRAVGEDPGSNPRGKPNPRTPAAAMLASLRNPLCPAVRSRPSLPTCPHTFHASRKLASPFQSLHRACHAEREASALQRQQPADLLQPRQAKEAPKPSRCCTVGPSALQCLHVASEPSRKQTCCRFLGHHSMSRVLCIADGSETSKKAGEGAPQSQSPYRDCGKDSELHVSTKVPRGDCEAARPKRPTSLLRSQET